MKQYRVIVTPDAERDLKCYLIYLRKVKKNPQAVKNVLKDFADTKKSLARTAGSIGEPKSEMLRARELKRINFSRHNYFLLFHIGEDNIAYVTNIFHGLEDYENKLR